MVWYFEEGVVAYLWITFLWLDLYLTLKFHKPFYFIVFYFIHSYRDDILTSVLLSVGAVLLLMISDWLHDTHPHIPTFPLLVASSLMLLFAITLAYWLSHQRLSKSVTEVLWRGWCGTLKRMVWYFEEGGVVLWRGWCGSLKRVVLYFEDGGVELWRWWCGLWRGWCCTLKRVVCYYLMR